MIRFADASLDMLIRREGHACACGRTHKAVIDYLSIRPGAVEDIPQALEAMGADALIIEVHNNPSKALCDGVQSQTPEMFASMMKKLDAIKPYAWKRG